MGADGHMPDSAEAKTTGSITAAPLTSAKARLAIGLSALAFYLLFVLRTSFDIGGTRYFVLFEDAMISMRYARHVADGHGFVWNIGEPPIEGFTNLLWVLWMSVAHKLGLSESKISLFIMLSGVAILLATGLVVSKIARKITDAPWVPIAVLAATLFDYPLVFWTLRGMEVGALTLAVYTLLWLALENEDDFSVKRTVLMGIVTSAALLIRSDSVVPVGLISLYAFLFCAKRWLFAAIIGTFAGGTVVGQTLFRKAVFHETLPNTYFLKLYKIPMSARVKRGAFVALEVLALHLAIPIATVLASVTGIDKQFWKDKAMRRMVLLGAIFSAQIAYATYVGGDAWEWMLYANRYMCAGMPALVVLVAVVLERTISRQGADADALRASFGRRLGVAIGAAGLLLVLLNVYAKLRPEQGIAATIVFSKTPFAAGAAFMGLGALLFFMKDLREGTTEALAALRRRFASRRTVTVAALVLMAVVWLPSHLLPLGRWAAQNAAQYKDEANYTRLGLLIRSTTAENFRIAVAAAGATPYFAQRPTEDLLGKNDRVIAKTAPRGVFSPGHDKWDYAYSLGERNSQLIVEAVDVNDADEQYMASLGFKELPNHMRLREGADVKNAEILGREMPDGATLATALGELGVSLPGGFGGADIGMMLVFGLVIAAAARGIAKDVEPYSALEEEAPGETPVDDPAVQKALSGADARTIPTLDGMRGIAVLAVLAFHFAWTFPGENPDVVAGTFDSFAIRMHGFLWSGWTGVDLFFVLSGYLITRGLVAPSKKPLGARMKSFWMRRVLRIFPLYYAVVIVGTIVGLVVGGWIPGPAYWLYMQNYVLAFDEHVMRWTAHFWSLAIEEQFYFVWPIVALMVSRRKLIPTIAILTLGVVGLRGFLTFKGAQIPALSGVWHADHEVAKFVYRATFTRADGLLLGAFVAVTQREATHPVSAIWRRVRFPLFVATGFALLGLYALANGLNDYDRRVIAIGYVTLAMFFASAVSMCADHVVRPATEKFLSWRPLVACGKVSYGMYIFHWPLVVLLVPKLEAMQKGMPMPTQIALGLGVVVGGTALMYVLAAISFRFFETPFLKLKGKFHD